MADTKCTGDHSIHICEFAKQEKFEIIKGVTGAPAAICTNCGRVANGKENLCNPVLFSEILKDGVYLSR
jgi:hypothetical protein